MSASIALDSEQLALDKEVRYLVVLRTDKLEGNHRKVLLDNGQAHGDKNGTVQQTFERIRPKDSPMNFGNFKRAKGWRALYPSRLPDSNDHLE